MTDPSQSYLLDLIKRLLPGWGSDEGACVEGAWDTYVEACHVVGLRPIWPDIELEIIYDLNVSEEASPENRVGVIATTYVGGQMTRSIWVVPDGRQGRVDDELKAVAEPALRAALEDLISTQA